MIRPFPFTLSINPVIPYGVDSRITPSQGEDFGDLLAEAAKAMMKRFKSSNPDGMVYWGPGVAQMFELAAQAYDHGAHASIGHTRPLRYLERARELRKTVASLVGGGS